jgi:threonyl-tRNA synthetase
MAEERKTLEQRHQMSDLERLRHSAAHVMATAILRIWPEAQFAAGPPVENGFYYDVDLPHRITPDDFPKIEEEMKKEIRANHPFERTVVTREEALELALTGRLGGLEYRPENASKFKVGNLQDIPEGEEISLYRNGDFLDLCAGPHVMRTGNIGAFRLTHVASAYYKGDEKNPQLQRIYGTAFKNKTQLEEYFTMLEEAKKRDHRKLGKELELFCFDDDVGPGLPLWLPRGTVLIEELEKLAKETEFAAGYDRVRTPHLARENMYLTSGHLPYYAESMFPPMVLTSENPARKERKPLIEEWEKLASELAGATRAAGAPQCFLFFVPGDALSEGFRELMGKENDPEKKLVEMRRNFDGFGEPLSELDKALNHLFESVAFQSIGWEILSEENKAKVIERHEYLRKCRQKLGELDKRLGRAVDEESWREQNSFIYDRYYLKAMNCPHHHKLFGAVPRSYRDLPLRLAEYGTCYRYEQSGELFGLMRVRAMQMNDAHIYCTEEQFASEFEAVNQMYLKYFKIFGIDRYQFRFSTHDPKELGKKYVDQSELWLKTEKMVRDVLVASGAPFVEVANEAAFYGPKIDIQIWSIIGKEFTLATNQVDFAVPQRFGLTYKTRDNTEATPLCIHRAPLGTHERFIGFVIEHYAGNFPLWLAPEQVRILPIGDEEPLVTYAKAIQAELRAEGVRATIDIGSDPIKAKIASAEQMKVHTMLVIGHRDLEANNVSVRIHGKGNVGAKPRAEFIADTLAAIKERRT